MTSLTRPTTRASGHIKLKFQLEIAQLLLPAARPGHVQIAATPHSKLPVPVPLCLCHAQQQLRDEKWMRCDALPCQLAALETEPEPEIRPADTFNLVCADATQPKRPNVPHCHAVAASGLPDAWLGPG